MTHQASGGQRFWARPEQGREAGRRTRAAAEQQDEGEPEQQHEGGGGRAPDNFQEHEYVEYARALRHAVDHYTGVHTRCGVWVFVARGNYRDRVERLGMELPQDQLTWDQRTLRGILEKCPLFDGKEERPGRTHWSNGACIVITPDDAAAVNWSDKSERDYFLGVQLQSKHIICSRCYYDLVIRLLHQGTWSPGHRCYIDKQFFRLFPDSAGGHSIGITEPRVYNAI